MRRAAAGPGGIVDCWTIGIGALPLVVGILASRRKVLAEVEARAHASDPAFPGWRVKAERKTYVGAERLKVRVRAPTATDGEVVTVRIGDAVVGAPEVRAGVARLDDERPTGTGVPEVAAGDVLTVEVGAVEVLRATFRPD